MITTSRILDTAPRSRLYGHTGDYHRARPGHSHHPDIVVSGIQEEDSRRVPGDTLAEWDVWFAPATAATPGRPVGDVLARRNVRRSRHSRTATVDDDSHPVILLATDVHRSFAEEIWQRVILAAERGGTLSDVLIEADSARR
ncbi:hypothetical protein [Gordonia sp. KTR9]|uniref:hypothetical protein n=1 Tax=Gordonia sp. KTR9 TaxID=337191 RepID=UPI00027DE9BD|nr:hypothetical protein [Gordonia sp. KTR9]AFR51102.1 hypothetical protein KTR9_4498 [Gordonia sp. KTR9]